MASSLLAPAHRAALMAPGIARLAALGIVFGDLGTSPLYTLQTVVQAAGGHFTPERALGVLSLIVWTLILTVSVKYCVFVMRADNRGEGGILALMLLDGATGFHPGMRVATAAGLLGAALIYGDGIITPAISVLSALEGVNVVTTTLKPWVLPISVLILLALFALQRFGTQKIGQAFGPVMLLWFCVIALIGAVGIIRHPAVLGAIDPRYALRFLLHADRSSLLVLGGVFLCITGAEALYADMGHFGKASIRWSWYAIVLPALLLSYAGQTGLLLQGAQFTGNPFFKLAPSWSIYPLVLLATIATIIASQAIITGSYSMTRQAMQLGWLPGVAIRQTSDRIYGQIYVPAVNWLMMLGTIGVAVAFRSSDRLAAAYGTAVSTTMLLTTGLLFIAMRRVWRWPLALTSLIGGLFLLIDLMFFGANLLKVVDGGWLPLSLATLLFLLMIIWRTGMDGIRDCLARTPESAAQFLADLRSDRIPRVPGTTVFLTRATQSIPPLVIEYVHFVGALTRDVIALHVDFLDVPRAEGQSCAVVDKVADGFWHVRCRFGFVEIPDLRRALAGLPGLDPPIDLEHAIFIGSRDLVVNRAGSGMLRRARLSAFAFLYRNAVKVVDRFNLPAPNVIEIARQIEI